MTGLDGVEGPLTASMCQSWVVENTNGRRPSTPSSPAMTGKKCVSIRRILLRPGDVAPSLGREQLVELLEVRRAVARRGERIVGEGLDVLGGGKPGRRRRVGTGGAPLVQVNQDGVGRLGADVVEEF